MFGIIQQLLQLFSYWKNRNTTEEEKEAKKSSQHGASILSCFNLAWFICGKLKYDSHIDTVKFIDVILVCTLEYKLLPYILIVYTKLLVLNCKIKHFSVQK